MEQNKRMNRFGGRPANMQNPPADRQEEIDPTREADGEGAADEEMLASFEEIAQSILQLSKEGKLPEGFDLEAACRDRAFVELVIDYSAEAAIRIYDAEKRLAEAESGAKQRVENDIRARRALPKSGRANLTANPAPDYRHMSADEFRNLEQQYKRAARNGRKVNL